MEGRRRPDVSTSFIPAHSFFYQKCCIIVVRGSPGATAKFVYSPNEEEVVLDRGTKLRLKSVRQVKTTPAVFKHPNIAIEDHPPFGGTVSLYEAVIVA
jgi:hypothetical protein